MPEDMEAEEELVDEFEQIEPEDDGYFEGEVEVEVDTFKELEFEDEFKEPLKGKLPKMPAKGKLPVDMETELKPETIEDYEDLEELEPISTEGEVMSTVVRLEHLPIND